MDDDTTILTMMGRILEEQGLEVWRADSQAQALDVVRRDGSVSVIILDWRLWGSTSESLFDEMLAIRPNARIIVTSGESPAAVRHAFAGRNVFRFLDKPFTMRALVSAVESAMALTRTSRAEPDRRGSRLAPAP